ncbi:hypothetical protein ACOSP7_030901 [Xanthoceras sorbifolium]
MKKKNLAPRILFCTRLRVPCRSSVGWVFYFTRRRFCGFFFLVFWSAAMEMEDVFVFSAEEPPVVMEEATDLQPNSNFNSKRARFDGDCEIPRKPMGASFKAKIMGTPSSWSEFDALKEKLNIGQYDVTYVEGSYGSSIRMFAELKEKLQKPWGNALILKCMGRSHTLNFMIQKLQQKWSLIGQWQLTDLENGYFVARFQFKDDLEAILTGSSWVIANQHVVAQKWKPNFVPGKQMIQCMPIWVRLSKLPMEWTYSKLLWKIGELLGSMCKVDPITETQAQGRFARICVEIDIS